MGLGWLNRTSCLDLWIPAYTTLKNDALAWECKIIYSLPWFCSEKKKLNTLTQTKEYEIILTKRTLGKIEIVHTLSKDKTVIMNSMSVKSSPGTAFFFLMAQSHHGFWNITKDSNQVLMFYQRDSIDSVLDSKVPN